METHMNKKIFLLLLICVLGSALFAERTWMKITRDGTVKEQWVDTTVSTDGDNRKIETVSEDGSAIVIVRPDGQATYLQEKGKEGQYTITRNGDTLNVSSEWNGKKTEATVSMKKSGWYGSTDQAFKVFQAEKKDKLVMLLVNPVDPKKTTEMQFIRQGTEKIAGTETIKVKMCLTGALASFWSANYWIRENGDVFRYEGDEGPGTKKMIVESIDKK